MGRRRGRRMGIIGEAQYPRQKTEYILYEHLQSKSCLITQGYGAVNVIAYRG